MTISANKVKKAAGKKRAFARSIPALPSSTATLKLAGKEYLVTPAADMAEWLEDLSDMLDSMTAMRAPGESIPWETARKSLGIRTPAKKKAAKVGAER